MTTPPTPITSPRLDRLGPQQRSVLESVWRRQEATVRQVWQDVGADRSLAYTTVLTVMQRLERSGWLRRERRGRAHAYRAVLPRAVAHAEALRGFVEEVLGGGDALGVARNGGLGLSRFSCLRDLVDARQAGVAA